MPAKASTESSNSTDLAHIWGLCWARQMDEQLPESLQRQGFLNKTSYWLGWKHCTFPLLLQEDPQSMGGSTDLSFGHTYKVSSSTAVTCMGTLYNAVRSAETRQRKIPTSLSKPQTSQTEGWILCFPPACTAATLSWGRPTPPKATPRHQPSLCAQPDAACDSLKAMKLTKTARGIHFKYSDMSFGNDRNQHKQTSTNASLKTENKTWKLKSTSWPHWLQLLCSAPEHNSYKYLPLVWEARAILPTISPTSGGYFWRKSFWSLRAASHFQQVFKNLKSLRSYCLTLVVFREGKCLVTAWTKSQNSAPGLTEFREGLSRWVFTASTFRLIVSTLQPLPKRQRSLHEEL